MKNLLSRINKFYKQYDIEHIGNTLTISKADMRNHDALMTAYESLWLTMDYYEDDSAEYQWMTALYADLGDYIAELSNPVYRWHSTTMGNIVQTFGEVIAQVWDSLIHYHTIDIKWQYCRKGY